MDNDDQGARPGGQQSHSSNTKTTANKIKPMPGQGWDPTRNHHQNNLPPPEDMTKYASRPLPLPPRSHSSSSSVYDSDATNKPTMRPGQAYAADPMDFAGFLDEKALAMVRPLRLNTDAPPRQEIVSPQPRHLPEHRILKVRTHDDEFSLVSPVLTPPSTIHPHDHENYTVSPLTPEGPMPASPRDLVAEFNNTPRMTAERDSRTLSTLSHADTGRTSPRPQNQAQKVQNIQKAKHRYSDPGSALDTARTYQLPVPSHDDHDSRRRSTQKLAVDGQRKPSPAASYQDGGPVNSSTSLWTRVGQQRSASNASSSKVSFAVNDLTGFSGRSKADRGNVPDRLSLTNTRSVEEHQKTPFPIYADAPVSGWDSDDSDDIKKAKRGSFGAFRSHDRKRSDSGSLGKLISKIASKVTPGESKERQRLRMSSNR